MGLRNKVENLEKLLCPKRGMVLKESWEILRQARLRAIGASPEYAKKYGALWGLDGTAGLPLVAEQENAYEFIAQG